LVPESWSFPRASRSPLTHYRFFFIAKQPSPRYARPSAFPASGGSRYPRRGPARSENSSAVRRKSPPTGNSIRRTPSVGSPSAAAPRPFATASARPKPQVQNRHLGRPPQREEEKRKSGPALCLPAPARGKQGGQAKTAKGRPTGGNDQKFGK
jgi:hypothetical protein